MYNIAYFCLLYICEVNCAILIINSSYMWLSMRKKSYPVNNGKFYLNQIHNLKGLDSTNNSYSTAGHMCVVVLIDLFILRLTAIIICGPFRKCGRLLY